MFAQLLKRSLLKLNTQLPRLACKCSGTSSPKIAKARSTLAPAATAARATTKIRVVKVSKRLAEPRASRRSRLCSHEHE